MLVVGSSVGRGHGVCLGVADESANRAQGQWEDLLCWLLMGV